MGLETGVAYIEDLVTTNPVGATDLVSEGDDHIRNIKTAVQGSFPNLGAEAVTKTAAELNDLATKGGGEQLQNKNLTNAKINGVTAYGLVILDDPVVLVSSSTTGSWTLMDMSAVYSAASDATAVYAIVRCTHTIVATANTTDIVSQVFVRRTGSSLVTTDLESRVSRSVGMLNTVLNDLETAGGTEFTIALDGSSDFDWYHDIFATGASTSTITLSLVAYYV